MAGNTKVRNQNIKQKSENKGSTKMKTKWEENPLHSPHPLRARNPDVDKSLTHK